MFISFRDTLQLLSKLTLNRIINAVLILGSYVFSRISGKPKILGMPISMALEPTTACNLRCPECPSGLRSFTRPTGKLELPRYQKLIDEISAKTTYLTFYFQGEPYLNPDFLEMVDYASKKRMYTATSTNAHFLDEDQAEATVKSGLDRLIISIDGTTQETYESYRKEGKLSKVLEGTRNIIQKKKELKRATPFVTWQFLVVRPNEHQIEEAELLAREYGVDKIAFKTAQIYDYELGSSLIPTIDKYSRYRLQPDGTYAVKNKLLDHCWKMWSSCVITWDGKVVPCCFDKDAHYTLGNTFESSFREIWNSRAYVDFRATLLKGRSEIEMCRNCTEGTKVWA